MWIRCVGAAVKMVSYSWDGRTVYTLEGGRLTAWDIASREPTRLLGNNQVAHISFTGNLFPVTHRYLVLGDYSGQVAWDLEAKKELKNIKLSAQCQPVGPNSTEVRFASDGGLIRSCDLATGKTTTVLRPPKGLKRIEQFAFSSDGKYALVRDNWGRGMLVELATGKTVPLSQRPEYGLDFVQFNEIGHFVCAVGEHLHVFNVTKPTKPIATHIMSYGLLVLHPRLPIYAALDAQFQFALFSLETGEPLRTFDLKFGKYLPSVAFSPDGLTCAVGGSNKRFAVFDVDL